MELKVTFAECLNRAIGKLSEAALQTVVMMWLTEFAAPEARQWTCMERHSCLGDQQFNNRWTTSEATLIRHSNFEFCTIVAVLAESKKRRL